MGNVVRLGSQPPKFMVRPFMEGRVRITAVPSGTVLFDGQMTDSKPFTLDTLPMEGEELIAVLMPKADPIPPA